jgi:hypothetical protein
MQMQSLAGLAFFSADVMTVRSDAQEIDQDPDNVPYDYRSRKNQQTVVDPKDLEDANDGRHPWVHTHA